MLELSLLMMLLAVASLLTAGVVKGTTGVGYSTTALPLMTLGMGLEQAMPIVLLPSISSNLFVMVEAGHFNESVRRFWPLYLATLPGLIGGLATLYFIDKSISVAILGVVLSLYSIYALSKSSLLLAENLERPLQAPVGFLNGFINGLTGSQMMPVVPFFLALPLTSNQMVQGMNIAFTFSSVVMIVGLTWIGYLNWSTLTVSALGILLAFLGVRVGTALRGRVNVETFRRMVLGLLLVLGLSLFGPAMIRVQ